MAFTPVKARFPQRTFCISKIPVYMEEWQDACDTIAPQQINCFQSNQYLEKNKPCTLLSRYDETVITRLRIGHSQVTHSYLLSRESQPVCDHCRCHSTVKHMLCRISK